MNYKDEYRSWLNNEYMNKETHRELKAISEEEEEIRDRFYQRMAFGTAGLRGKLGAGTNRMNLYTVAEATEGFARMIDQKGPQARRRGVAIGYDVRHQSMEFAKLAAEVFAAHDIHVFLHPDICPTPLLSYTVRKLHTFAGVMITASHNPKEYNGYKAYNDDGSQILDDWADEIEKNIGEVTSYFSIPRLSFDIALENKRVEYVPASLLESYYQDVLSLTIHDDDNTLDRSISCVYSPLNGCGNKPVRHILKERGFHEIHVVPEQENPDPDFTTVGYPNPEDPKAFHLAEKLGEKLGAELLFATDPDSDRCALEVRDQEGAYVFLNGNQIGALLGHYILSQLSALGKLPPHPAVIKSIVTGDMLLAEAQEFGAKGFEVLTGFKNIAGLVNRWDKTGEYSYVYGFEESIGYNASTFVRDKDAVSSAMLIMEMAAFYKKKGMSLLDALEALYQHYGSYSEKLFSFVLEGQEGKERIGRIMEAFRKNPIEQIQEKRLLKAIDYEQEETGLPRSNVLKYQYEGDFWFAVRPSGTEPKIKLYLYARGANKKDSQEKLLAMEKAAKKRMESVN